VTDAARIREWARAMGLDVPDVGRVPAWIIGQYQQAHPETSPAAADPDAAAGETLITVTAWDEGWEAPIAQAVADLISVIEASTRDRVLTELRAHLEVAQ
jgi:hypothetical protein